MWRKNVSSTFLLNTLKNDCPSFQLLIRFQIFSNSKYYTRHMKSIAFCSVFSALSNEILFKKISCEMAENEVIKNMSYFHKKQQTPIFFKNSVSLSKKFFFPKSLVVVVS